MLGTRYSQSLNITQQQLVENLMYPFGLPKTRAQKEACSHNDIFLFLIHLTLVRQSRADATLVGKIEQKGKGNSTFEGEKLGKACDVNICCLRHHASTSY